MVNQKLLHPQEVEVFIILPAIRREISIRMKKKGLEQKEIARRLCVTDAAISQYIKSKRGQAEIDFPSTLSDEFDKAVERIVDESTMRDEVQRLLKLVMHSTVTCQIHKKIVSGVPKNCLVCFKENPRELEAVDKSHDAEGEEEAAVSQEPPILGKLPEKKTGKKESNPLDTALEKMDKYDEGTPPYSRKDGCC